MGRERLIMTVTVGLLATAILIVFLAYTSFTDENNATDKSRRKYSEYGNAASLRMVAIIFRHGERSPTELYPNDPHQNYNWTRGFGTLTPNGSKQLYTLGRILNARFKRLLPSDEIYSINEMNVLSSAAERCLMSAQAFLAGFLPPPNGIMPIPWQPISVNALPRDRDNLLAQKMACPKYDKLLKEYYDKPSGDILETNQKNADLYKYLTEKTGKTVETVQHVEQLYNTLIIERDMGLALPDWTKDVFPDRMLPLAERNMGLLTETTFMKRVKGGALISNIFDKMDLKSKSKLQPNRSIFIYSAHDVTLVNVMRTLGIIDQTSRKPDYGSSLVFELHAHNTQNSLKDYVLKIFYYANSSTESPKEIHIADCTPICTLNKFEELIKSDIYLNDYNEDCKL